MKLIIKAVMTQKGVSVRNSNIVGQYVTPICASYTMIIYYNMIV